MIEYLRPKTRRLLRWINEGANDGYPYSRRELAKRGDYSSCGAVNVQVNELKEAGQVWGTNTRPERLLPVRSSIEVAPPGAEPAGDGAGGRLPPRHVGVVLPPAI